MKKLLSISFALFALNAANAQQITSKKGFPILPEKGDWSISFNPEGVFKYIGDVGFNSGGGISPDVTGATYSNLDTFSNDLYFVGKKFITDKSAYRAVARLNFTRSNIITTDDEAGPNNNQTNVNKDFTTNFDLTVGLGKEWRRGKTRLQGYYGADVLLNVRSLNRSKETNSLNLNNGSAKEVKGRDGMSIGVGAQGFIGAEYFILPKIAIGAQYDMSFFVRYQGRGKDDVTPWTGSGTSTKRTRSENGIQLGNMSVTSIRLSLYF